MSEKVQLKGCIYEVNFGYDTKVEGYVNLSSGITKLADMALGNHKLEVKYGRMDVVDIINRFFGGS
jgi:hypothetical protein